MQIINQLQLMMTAAECGRPDTILDSVAYIETVLERIKTAA